MEYILKLCASKIYLDIILHIRLNFSSYLFQSRTRVKILYEFFRRVRKIAESDS